MSEQVWWYATRAAGLMTWATATASVVFGLLLSTRAIRRRTGPWFLDFHRFLGGISVVFLAAHLLTLWADSYVEFGVKEIFVPGESPWETEAIAWGIVAAYLLVAIEVSSLLRSRVPGAVWRVIHFSSFAAMIAGSYHAITAGSDVDNPVTWVIAGIGTVLVIGLVSLRLQRQDPDEPGLTHASDNRAILEEMRQRLADLPVPESTFRPPVAVTPNPNLPRRAPSADSLPGITAEPESEPSAEPAIGFAADPFAADPFAADPFAAVPLPNDAPQLGSWVDPSPADPFGARDEDPFTEPEPPAEPEPPLDPPPVFSTTVADDPARPFVGNPFEPAVPTPSAIQAPAPDPEPGEGPPPLPNAVDPVTGEPDEAAYRAWLKDWLRYAERYGDEAPEDPSRV